MQLFPALTPPIYPNQLRSATPHDWPVAPDWQPIVDAFFASHNGLNLLHFLRQRLSSGAVIFPHQPLHALALTSAAATHTVILGQDPYHGPGQAHGLAFSVPSGVPIPPSLRNIFQEIQRDTGTPPPTFPQPGGNLEAWARTGVLLLNTTLTVENGQPASHAQRGWQALTCAVLQHLARRPKPLVFMLWGTHAQSYAPMIAEQAQHNPCPHLILSANHPSPLSARRGPQPFIGCGHFGQAAQFLAQNQTSISCPNPLKP